MRKRWCAVGLKGGLASALTSIAISKVPGAKHRTDYGAFPMEIQASRCSISAERTLGLPCFRFQAIRLS